MTPPPIFCSISLLPLQFHARTFYSFCCALQGPPKAAARVPKRCALFDSDSDDDAPTIATKPEPPAPQCGPAQTLPSPKSALTESKCPNLSPPAPIATAVPLARPEALSVAQRKGLFESDEGPPTATSQPKCQAQGSVQVSAKTAVCAAPVVTRPHPKSKGLFDSGDEDSGSDTPPPQPDRALPSSAAVPTIPGRPGALAPDTPGTNQGQAPPPVQKPTV